MHTTMASNNRPSNNENEGDLPSFPAPQSHELEPLNVDKVSIIFYARVQVDEFIPQCWLHVPYVNF